MIIYIIQMRKNKALTPIIKLKNIVNKHDERQARKKIKSLFIS